MGTILSRIQEIALNENITIRALERQIGASKGVISRALNNGTDIQSKWIQIIVEKYPRYSADWLLTGGGTMIKSSSDHLVTTDKKVECPVAIPVSNPGEGIPLIPIDAMAGAMVGDQTVLDYECDYYTVPGFKGSDFLIPVKGSSMSPTYNSGDIVACKRIPMGDIFFQWNKVYVIDTNQGALIKRIKPSSDPRHILIVSDNPDYDPFELSVDAIRAVALVIGVIHIDE